MAMIINNKQRFGYILLFSLSLSFLSCEKEDSPTPKEKLLTIREWRITDITRPKITNPSQDSSIIKTCSNDDRLTFGSNKLFQLKDNTTKCDTTIFAYDNGSWNMDVSLNLLTLSGSRRTQLWKILSLNDSLMKVQWRDSVSVSNNILKTIYLKNK